MFREGFSRLEENLSKRYYTSISAFSEDFGSVVNSALSAPSDEAADTAHTQDSGETLAKDSRIDHKTKKALVTRIIKAVKSPFEDALRKESELCQMPFEKELANLDRLLEKSVLSRRDSMAGSQLGTVEIDAMHLRSSISSASSDGHLNSINKETAPAHGVRSGGNVDLDSGIITNGSADKRSNKRQRPTPDSVPSTNGMNGDSRKTNGVRSASSQASKDNQTAEPPTPPLSSGGDSQPSLNGGIPWYMKPFDPVGTTVQEERWTGRELVRGMSEDLSDMDEEELSGLVEADDVPAGNINSAEQAAKAKEKKRKAANARRRRGY